MSRPISPVTASAIACVLAMSAFVLTVGCGRTKTEGCFGPGCSTNVQSKGPQTHKSLGLIDL